MTTKQQTKFVREGDYVAEVAVDLISENDGWAPYLSPTDAKNSTPFVRLCEMALSDRPLNWQRYTN